MGQAGIADQIQLKAQHAVREAAPWLVWLGRLGYAAKGVVYTLIGVLAFQAAIGSGGETTNTTGVFERIDDAQFGRILLIAMGVGLAGYALWRFLQAIKDTENKGADAKGIAIRVGYAGIGLVHLGLAVSAFAIVSGKAGGGDSAPGWTAKLMSQPLGRWLVAIAGAMILARGAFQVYQAYSRKFREKLMLRKMSANGEKWATRLGRMGYVARGVVFAIIGVFLILAAIREDPSEARGLDGALDVVARQPWGWVILAIVAMGLIAYGLFMFVESRYRRMVLT